MNDGKNCHNLFSSPYYTPSHLTSFPILLVPSSLLLFYSLHLVVNIKYYFIFPKKKEFEDLI